jgi:hypothetical protein
MIEQKGEFELAVLTIGGYSAMVGKSSIEGNRRSIRHY